jgi:tetratricopeptide (TPR) repeat protein
VSQFEPAAPPDAGLLTGSLLANRYELGALLGKGGVGQVYAARDRTLQREVAVKLLSSASPGPDAMQRFSREALATGSLQHPNIVAVYDVGEDQGRPYLVTELLHGGTLRALLEQGALPAQQAQAFARQIAAGLAAAHDKGFTHRDLKPENVFITGDGWLKILDFGLVKLTESLHDLPDAPPPLSQQPEASGATGVGRTLGTIGYMAPEQVRGQPVDPRADLFNFGLVFYEMLAGVRGFKGTSNTEISYAILFRQPPPLPKTVPAEMRRLIYHCLMKDRGQRPASAREVLASLKELEAGRLRSPAWHARLRPRLLPALAVVTVVIYVNRSAWREAPDPVVKVPIAPQPPPVGTVAIFPFGVRDAPNFAVLAEGVGDLLSSDFEGYGLRAAGPASVMNAAGGMEITDLDRAHAAAVRLGAKYFVLGRIEERKGGALWLLAVLHNTETTEPVSEASAHGDPAQLLRHIRTLSDQLQIRPLRPEVFEQRLAKLANQTSASTPALLAWLEGEQFFRRSEWKGPKGATAAFQRAIEADREFGLAHYRLGIVNFLLNPGVTDDELEAAVRYTNRLRPADLEKARAFLAIQHGQIDEAERILLEASRKFPEEPEVWLSLAELYFHQGPVRGHSPQEAMNALNQVTSLDPLNVDAIGHLADLAQLRGERALVSRYSERLMSLTSEPLMRNMYRLARSWAESDTAERDQVMAWLRTPVDHSSLWAMFDRAEWQMDNLADAEAVAAVFSRKDEFQPMAAIGLLRGQPDAARQAMAPYAAEDPSGEGAYFTLWIDGLDDFEISAKQLAASRAAAVRFEGGTSSEQRAPALHFVTGQLAVRAHDYDAALAEAKTLSGLPPLGASSITTDLALSLRARIAADKGHYRTALALLDKQQLTLPTRQLNRYYLNRAPENFFRASVLVKLGRSSEALRLYEAITFYSVNDPLLAPVGHLHQGEIYAEQGKLPPAIEHYEIFVGMWKNCEPLQRERLAKAEKRLDELRKRIAK